MTRNIIWFLALFILLLIQAGILQPVHIAPVNLILIIVSLSAILSDFNQGLIITLLGGILLDLVSGSTDGLMSISLLAVFLIMRLIMNEILAREPNQFILAASVGSSTIVFYLVFVGLSQIFALVNLSQAPQARYLLTVQLPLAIMWNLILGYPLFRYYSMVQNLVSKLPFHEEPIRT